MGGRKLVSVIIINFNSKYYLTKCVNSVLNSTIPVEVVVVDNCSKDRSLSLLKDAILNEPRLRIIENKANLGFARANNQAIPMTKGDYVLFLNPDCIIKPDTLQDMMAVMDYHPDAGMISCLIRNPDGSEQAGSRRYIPTPFRSMIRVLKLSKFFHKNPELGVLNLHSQPLPDHPAPMEAISGAFMFIRRKALEEVGPMDDQYFLHCEDLDWCMRFGIAGWKILFVPNVEIMHAKGACSVDRQVRVEWYKHNGMVRFYCKFFRDQYPIGLMYLVVMVVWIRFILLATYLSFKKLF
jgi:GT2 family glycosyltransferase